MSILQKLINSPTPAPPKMIVYGQPGVGKTTFAAQANAVLLDCEGGAGSIPNLIRTPYLSTWHEAKQWIDALAAEQEPPDVVAIDTLDWLLAKIEEHIIVDTPPAKTKNETTTSADGILNTIASAHGGWYNARNIVTALIRRDLLPALNVLVQKGTAIMLLAHASNEKMITPEGSTIKMCAPDLPNYIVQVFIEWADAILYVRKQGDVRTVVTQGTNIIIAKNRYSLPAEMPLDWDTLMAAVKGEHV